MHLDLTFVDLTYIGKCLIFSPDSWNAFLNDIFLWFWNFSFRGPTVYMKELNYLFPFHWFVCFWTCLWGEKNAKRLSFASPPPWPPFCLGSADPVYWHICAGPAVALTMAATLASEWLAPCVASTQALEALHCETEQQGKVFNLDIWISLFP